MEEAGKWRRNRQSSKSFSEQQQPTVEEEQSGSAANDDDVLIIGEEEAINTHDSLPFADGGWDGRKYCEGIAIKMVNKSVDGLDLEFDLISVEAPIANALRRILIAEVPTMAIEKVYLYQNTSCIQDEVLCHRLGLLPIFADARYFDFPHSTNDDASTSQPDYLDEEPKGDPKQNLVFELLVECPNDPRVKKKRGGKGSSTSAAGGSDGEEQQQQQHIGGDESIVREANDSGNWVLFSRAFRWCPISAGQRHRLTQWDAPEPRMVHDDIILAKLRPGQEIEARCHCVKGIGRDHAKFSPVATATYRLLPLIKLKRDEFDEEQAKRLQSSFSSGVIGRHEHSGRVYVKDARADTCSRNVFMHEDLKDAVEMGKKKTHFIFSVESTGAYPAHQLVIEACKVMREKVDNLREQLAEKLLEA